MASWFETREALTMRVLDLILKSIAKRCVSKDKATDAGMHYANTPKLLAARQLRQ